MPKILSGILVLVQEFELVLFSFALCFAKKSFKSLYCREPWLFILVIIYKDFSISFFYFNKKNVFA